MQKEAAEAGLRIYTIKDLIKTGFKSEVVLDDSKPMDLFTVCYTSGTTGNPKGVMLSNRNMVGMCATQATSPVALYNNDVHLSYLPLAHIMERCVLYCIISNGAKYGLFQGDILKLKDDMEELKPTIFVSVPRLYTRFYDIMQSKVRELKGCAKKIAAKAITAKLQNLHKSGTVTH